MPNLRNQIHRQHIHGIHEENPNKHRESQGRNQLAACGIANNTLGLVFHHLRQNFNSRLEAPRHARSSLARGKPQHKTAQRTQNNREKQRVKVEKTKVNNAGLLHTLKRKIFLQMLQMVLNVFTSGWTACFKSFCSRHKYQLVEIIQYTAREALRLCNQNMANQDAFIVTTKPANNASQFKFNTTLGASTSITNVKTILTASQKNTPASA